MSLKIIVENHVFRIKGRMQMNLISVSRMFSDRKACIAHLEGVRWSNEPQFRHRGGSGAHRKTGNDRTGRSHRHDCYSDFNAHSGAVFEKTGIPRQKQFLGIALTVNAKECLSGCRLGRYVEIPTQAARHMQRRIRAAMAKLPAKNAVMGPISCGVPKCSTFPNT